MSPGFFRTSFFLARRLRTYTPLRQTDLGWLYLKKFSGKEKSYVEFCGEIAKPFVEDRGIFALRHSLEEIVHT